MDDAPAIPKLRTPDIPPVEQRKPLSRWEFAVLMLQQQGKCANCSARLEKGKVRDEHLHALHLGGGNELSNRALWCLDCTKPKDARDKAAIAKGKRIRGETCTGPKRKIESRGFQQPSLPMHVRTSRAPKKLGWGKPPVSRLSKKYRDQVKARMK